MPTILPIILLLPPRPPFALSTSKVTYNGGATLHCPASLSGVEYDCSYLQTSYIRINARFGKIYFLNLKEKAMNKNLFVLPTVILLLSLSGAFGVIPLKRDSVGLVLSGTQISGKVTSSDGKPLVLAHVFLTNLQGNYRQPLQTVAVGEDGQFAIQVPEPGMYRLFITAVNHDHPSIPLILDAEMPEVEVDVQLAPLDYKHQFDAVQIIGDWNNFNWNDADSMKKQEDGTFIYERQVQADTTSYQLIGITRDSRSVNGTQADYYTYDGGGDYISVLKVKQGKVRIIFEPTKLLRTTDRSLPHVVFRKQNSRLQKLWDVESNVQKQKDTYISSAMKYRETHDDMEGFRFDWSETVAILKNQMHEESDRVVRQFAAIQLCQLLVYNVDIDSASVVEILDLLPPNSAMWSIQPMLVGGVGSKLGKERGKQILKQFLDENPDREVRAMSLPHLIWMARKEGDKEGATRYYDKLKDEYGDLPDAQYYIKALDPNKRIMAGKPVPDFEVKLMGNNETVSNKSLLSKFYLLDFWATWCGPCVAEMKNLHTAYDKFKDKNFTILSLSFDAKPENVVKFREKKWKMPWMHAFVKGGFSSELAKTFEVLGIPKPILVGPDGIILEMEGALRGANLENTLVKYLGSPSKQ